MPASEPAGSPRWYTSVGAGLAFALLTLLAFPPFDIWPLALLAPIPLIWLAVGESRRFALPPAPSRLARLRRALRTPLLISAAVLPMWVFQEWWLLAVTGPGFVPMTIGLALFSGIFVYLAARMNAGLRGIPLALSAPILWVALEFFRGEIAFTGYPWLFAGHPLINYPPLARPAAAFGTYFVSFLVVAVGALLTQGWVQRRFPIRPALILLVLAAIGFVLGARPLAPAAPPLRIAVVQTNVTTSNKLAWSIEQQLADFQRFVDLTREAASVVPKPDLIVWPETMFPGPALDPAAVEELRRSRLYARVDPAVREEGRVMLTEFPDRLLALQRELGIPFVIGAVGYDNLRITVPEDAPPEFAQDARYNSAFLIDQGQVLARYDKIELTPFGEVMPYIHHWPWLEDRLLALGAHGMSFDLSHGKSPRLLQLDRSGGAQARDQIDIAAPICFEATDADVVRAIARAAQPGRPMVLINLTNDGWFNVSDTGRWQHLLGARWRAVEIGVPLVRAANTGVSSAFDARGGIIALGVPGRPFTNADGVMFAEISPRPPSTFFLRVGNLFAWLNLIAAIALIFLARPRLARSPRPADSQATQGARP